MTRNTRQDGLGHHRVTASHVDPCPTRARSKELEGRQALCLVNVHRHVRGARGARQGYHTPTAIMVRGAPHQACRGGSALGSTKGINNRGACMLVCVYSHLSPCTNHRPSCAHALASLTAAMRTTQRRSFSIFYRIDTDGCRRWMRCRQA